MATTVLPPALRADVEWFPRGEAVHYREHAMTLGVPADVISIETEATNTSQNLTNSRQVLNGSPSTPAAASPSNRT